MQYAATDTGTRSNSGVVMEQKPKSLGSSQEAVVGKHFEQFHVSNGQQAGAFGQARGSRAPAAFRTTHTSSP